MTFEQILQTLHGMLGSYVVVTTKVRSQDPDRFLTQAHGVLKAGKTLGIGDTPAVAELFGGGDSIVLSIADDDGVTRSTVWIAEDDFESGSVTELGGGRTRIEYVMAGVLVEIFPPAEPDPLPE